MKVFKPMLIILAALATVIVVSLALRPHERVPWRQGFAAARAEARQTGKPMLVDFTADWCGYCQEMRRTTWSDVNVEQAVRDYVPVQVDVDREPSLAAQYHVSGLPHLVVLDPQGNVLKQIDGALPPDQFIAWLRSNSPFTGLLLGVGQ